MGAGLQANQVVRQAKPPLESADSSETPALSPPVPEPRNDLESPMLDCLQRAYSGTESGSVSRAALEAMRVSAVHPSTLGERSIDTGAIFYMMALYVVAREPWSEPRSKLRDHRLLMA